MHVEDVLSVPAYRELAAVNPRERAVSMAWSTAHALREAGYGDLAEDAAGLAFRIASRIESTRER
jgi:hypothetical protein